MLMLNFFNLYVTVGLSKWFLLNNNKGRSGAVRNFGYDIEDTVD